MFVSDTVEDGQWKFGPRNDSVMLWLQPFIYKLGSAVASGIVRWTARLRSHDETARAARSLVVQTQSRGVRGEGWGRRGWGGDAGDILISR